MEVIKMKEGGLRLLTSGEIALARGVFKNTISWHKVWIHHDSYLPFGLQSRNAAMAPNGEIYFRNNYRDDFSKESIALQHIFIHELAHVWQREKGMNVRIRGLFSWAADYTYTLGERFLNEYALEQQAQIIADYFVLDKFGYQSWLDGKRYFGITCLNDEPEALIRSRYAKVLLLF